MQGTVLCPSVTWSGSGTSGDTPYARIQGPSGCSLVAGKDGGLCDACEFALAASKDRVLGLLKPLLVTPYHWRKEPAMRLVLIRDEFLVREMRTAADKELIDFLPKTLVGSEMIIVYPDTAQSGPDLVCLIVTPGSIAGSQGMSAAEIRAAFGV